MNRAYVVLQADAILPEDEAKLWDVGVFEKKNAEQLQKTIFFYACKIFGLRGCDEHHTWIANSLPLDQTSWGNLFSLQVGKPKHTKEGSDI